MVGIAKAQPTITSSSEAIPGDINIYQLAQTNGVALPATGAGLTWDYSGLIDSGGYAIDTFISPSSTPYASLFPGTNLASNGGNGGYIYYKTTTGNPSDWTTLGITTPGSDTDYYRSGLNEFHFSFTYGSSFTDSTEFVFGSGLSDSFETVVTHQGAGYGTLKLPGGQTFTNVLEVKTTTIQRLSTFFSSTIISYLFVSPGTRSYIMRITLNAQNGITDIRGLTTGVAPPPTSFTFNGNGSWNVATNWKGGVAPTSPIPSGTTVTISPTAGGSCTLNVPVTFNVGSTLTVATGAIFNVMGNLTIVK
jgi:hypothetical protein